MLIYILLFSYLSNKDPLEQIKKQLYKLVEQNALVIIWNTESKQIYENGSLCDRIQSDSLTVMTLVKKAKAGFIMRHFLSHTQFNLNRLMSFVVNEDFDAYFEYFDYLCYIYLLTDQEMMPLDPTKTENLVFIIGKKENPFYKLPTLTLTEEKKDFFYKSLEFDELFKLLESFSTEKTFFSKKKKILHNIFYYIVDDNNYLKIVGERIAADMNEEKAKLDFPFFEDINFTKKEPAPSEKTEEVKPKEIAQEEKMARKSVETVKIVESKKRKLNLLLVFLILFISLVLFLLALCVIRKVSKEKEIKKKEKIQVSLKKI